MLNPVMLIEPSKQCLKTERNKLLSKIFPEAVDALPIEETQPDALEEKPLQRAEVKKKARMRPKGSAKRIRTERKG